MRTYEIPDEPTWNSVIGSLGTYRIRRMIINVQYHDYMVIGDCDAFPDEETIIFIKDKTLYRRLLEATLDS